jgi:long-chain fatty acid transport protein
MPLRAAIAAPVAAAALLAGVAVPASAQSDANQRNMLPGGRAALMGGAFTALADDASGAYYNPAGLAFAKDPRIEVSTNGYRATKITYADAVAGDAFQERSQALYPSFIGGTVRAGSVTFAYAYMTLDARNVFQRHEFSDVATEDGVANSYERTQHETSNYLWAGGSLAVRLAPHWSLGTSLFYYQRTAETSTAELLRTNGGGLLAVDDTIATLNTGVATATGLVYRNDVIAIGVGARLARALSDTSNVSSGIVRYDPEGAEAAPTVTHTDTDAPQLAELNPPTYALGLALLPSGPLTVAADLLLHEGVSSPHHDDGGVDLQTVLNYSVGLELDLGPVRVLAGQFTNESMLPEPTAGRVDQPTSIDYLGRSAGIGWDVRGFTGEVGVVQQRGSGAAQLGRGAAAIQAVDAEIISYVLSGRVPL